MELAIRLIESNYSPDMKGIFHCFSGNIRQAERAVELGFKLGIGGVVTFKNSGLQQVVKAVPLEHLLLETDAPYLAPVPYRGQRNEPAYIPLIAATVAEIKCISLEAVAEVTTREAKRVFKVDELMS
jgi:TatD DNase family protein